MKGESSAAQMRAIFRAIRLTNAADSITHGPRIKPGSLPPRVTGPIVKGFTFKAAKKKSLASRQNVGQTLHLSAGYAADLTTDPLDAPANNNPLEISPVSIVEPAKSRTFGCL